MPDSPAPNSPGTAAGARSAERGIPLTLAQQAALLPERMRRVPAADLAVALEISPPPDAAALDRAAVAVIAEHEILRTVYPGDRRIPYQRVVPAPESVVEVVETAAAALADALSADAAHRFDLLGELPVRIRLHRLPDRAVLSVVVHPVAADDRSLEALVAALFAAYDGAAAAAGAQYRTFALAQLKTLAGNAAEDAGLIYWLQRLADLPERADLTDAEPVAEPVSRRVFRVPSAALPGASTEATFAALVAHALSAGGMGDDIAVGIVDPEREAAATALGNFTNHLVLRIDTAGDASPRQLAERTAEQADEARAHTGTRIERLTHQMRGAAAVSSGSLFQALVTVRPGTPIVPEATGRTVRELSRRTARPHGVDVVVDVLTDADGATVTVDFAPALAEHPETPGFATLLEQTYARWIEAPDAARTPVPDAPSLFTRDAAAEPGVTGLGGAPRTDAERLLADAIREILDLDEDDEVGRKDTFFSLGGDSIAALRLVTLLGERGHALDVQKVFEFPALYELAEQLESADPAAAATAAPAPAVAPMSASGLDPAALQALGKKFAGR
ncbi:condensation domain-containing protein [Nocardia blacklockiae]|uniref:condensation domain-containing protein n=1 Tax=Nocardia blacklockiae TaxID=480036 RepID=UPI0018930945|nr:condensation domain-containing protein [Nocardia blacklockiae]MBF6171469.1 thioester reductase [Nocardia blacklockiae]